MRKIILFGSIIVCLALAGCAGARSDLQSARLLAPGVAAEPTQAAEPGSITVTGEAEVKVVPDEVILNLGVETSDLNLTVARQKNDEIVQRVIALAKENGIEQKYIQTDYLGVEPRYEDSSYRYHLIGYFVQKTIVLTLHDLTRFESLLTGALQAGVNYVHGIEFRTTELRKYRDQARSLAIQAAQEKATALAGELNCTVGVPLHIQEERNWWWSGYSSWWGARWGGGMTQNVTQNMAGTSEIPEGALAPGMISVSATVTVEFRIK